MLKVMNLNGKNKNEKCLSPLEKLELWYKHQLSEGPKGREAIQRKVQRIQKAFNDYAKKHR